MLLHMAYVCTGYLYRRRRLRGTEQERDTERKGRTKLFLRHMLSSCTWCSHRVSQSTVVLCGCSYEVERFSFFCTDRNRDIRRESNLRTHPFFIREQ